MEKSVQPFFALIKGAAKSCVNYCLYFFATALPRNKSIWVYSGMSGRFNDNSKYIFLYASKKFTEIRHVWLSASDEVILFLRSKGFECYHRYSLKGIILCLRAKVFVYSAYVTDINHFSLSGGAFHFNLWHGIPLKKIEYDITKGPLKSIYQPSGFKEKLFRFISYPSLARRHSAVLTTSGYLKQIFAKAFRLKEEKVLVSQYPRVMPFFWSHDELNRHIDTYESIELRKLITDMQRYTEVWIYMPTWRDTNPAFLSQAIRDFDCLNRICNENNILLLLKLHINSVFESDMSSYSNILLVEKSVDIYPLLPFTHTLITDYSSIFFDYSILKKRIIFYPYDLQDYLSGSREFYFDYSDIIKGREVVYNFNELINLLKNRNSSINSTCQDFKIFVSNDTDFNAPVNFIKQQINF